MVMDFLITQDYILGRYNRVTIIYPNGKKDVISSQDFYNHFRYFMFYVKEHKFKVFELNQLFEQGCRDLFLYIQAFLNCFHALVILDITLLDDEPIIYQIEMFVPDRVTYEQWRQLSDSQDYFYEYEIFLEGGHSFVTLAQLEEQFAECKINEYFPNNYYGDCLAYIKKHLVKSRKIV